MQFGTLSIDEEKLSADASKEDVITYVKSLIQQLDLDVEEEDVLRPWGGFFRFTEDESFDTFLETFYKEEGILRDATKKMSPKILIVAPHARLSWQYHHRRAELWKVFAGPVGVVMSDTDEQSDVQTFNNGELVTLKQGERHRLVGLDTWGLVAEIWQHTDPTQPSDEEDIVRVEDDFGR